MKRHFLHPHAPDHKPGRTTLKTLSQHLGLSVTTVSRALKNGSEVRPGTIARVQEAAKAMGYRPNASGLSLKTGKTHTIAMLMPVIKPGEVLGDVGAMSLIEGLTAGLSDTPYHLTLLPCRDDQDLLSSVRYVVENGLADGLILNETRYDDVRVKYLSTMGMPFVTFGRTELSIEHPYYDTDNTDFAFRAVQYLLEKGRKRPLLITPSKELLFSWHRQVGFKRALLEAGLTFSEEQVVYEGKALDYRQLAHSFARTDYSPDGIICGSEVAAMGILAGLQDVGLTPGKECDLVSMETSSLPDYFGHPVSGFRQDLHRIGRELSQLLLAHLEDQPVQSLQKVETATFIDRI